AFTVPRTVFMPQPNVDSAIIQLKTLKELPVHIKNEPLFFKVVRASFVQRRKTIWNNLKKILSDKNKEQESKEAFQKDNVEPARRGESLPIEEYGHLVDELVYYNLEDSFL